MKVAVIPARGGSKRIPRKNIKLFLGKPIIAYSIEVAQESGLFDEVIVSTEDREIADIAIEHGASVPFFREESLADDHATIMDVLVYTYDQLCETGEIIENLCCIYATAPFVRAEALREGAAALEASSSLVALSVAKFNYPIQRALAINEQGQLQMLDETYLTTRSQDLPEAYMDAAQFIWCDGALFAQKSKSLFDHGVCPVVLPSAEVQDIDTLEDWERAEAIFQYLKQKREAQS